MSTDSEAFSTVPQEYYPNYKITGKREKTLDILENIEAAVKVGTGIANSTFGELHNLFSDVFPYFPQSPANNVIYKQCLLTTQDLAWGVTTPKYTLFKDRCFNPIGDIIKQITTKYTVKADATVKPKQGPAPLNVTLDARNSVDPSIDTIPSEYFFWYYKDVDGNERPIGKGPVINYTFPDPGNHIVHLTVRSSNRQTEGVFDGEKSIAVNVAPKAAQINLFVNGKKAMKDRLLKIGTPDIDRGILLDASATKPIGARKIVSYTREIMNDQKYSFKQSGQGTPGQFFHNFPGQGIYTITLEIVDNENNKLRESFRISISDPVAIIKAKPEAGTTSTQFVFDAGASYSISSKIKKYQWQVIDPNGNQLDLIDGKDIKQQYILPGTYTIKLTVTDTSNAISTDTFLLDVKSTPPVPSFIVTPTTNLKYPSKFRLDANSTYDEDIRYGNDSLTYARTFSSPDNVKLEQESDDKKEILVSFTNPGTYKARLVVTDSYGEQAVIEKDIEVVSTLRPEMFVTPLVSAWWTEVTFVGRTNKPVAFYEWDFGDGKKQQTQDPKITYTYDKAGIYQVTLRVLTDNQEENIVTKNVFAGQKDLPLVAWVVKSTKGNIELSPNSTCDTASGEVPAYRVERYEPLILDATDARNVKGEMNNLNVSFIPQNDEVYNKSVLNYRFAELGCQWIEVHAEDTTVGKSAKERIQFEVVNALPTMQNLVLGFPQATNSQKQLWVGITTTSIVDEGLNLDLSLSSIIVQAEVKGARDPDGSISYFRRRYYPNDDETRKEAFKITPAAIPRATFVIPKPGSPTEYSFVVEIVDNDGGRMRSEDLLGKWPVIFFPPGEIQLDQPIVSLNISTVNTKVGDDVTFQVTASIPSERPDFEATRIIKYDFDGDGIYDQTTKKTEVSYQYSKAGTYTPKVAVFYRDRAGVAFAEPITVIKSVSPRLLYNTFDKIALVRDISLGDIEEKSICMNLQACLGTGEAPIFTGDIFVYTYPDYGEYITRFQLIDAYGNEIEKKDRLTMREETGFALLSIPEAILGSQGWYEITIGNALQNTVALYPVDTKNCYIDLDITEDSNGDGDPAIDQDVACNELYTQHFTPRQKIQEARIYHVVDDKVVQEPLLLNFLDVEQDLIPAGYEHIAEEIDALLSDLPSAPEDVYQDYYRQSLRNLRSSLGDETERNSLVIQLRDLVGNYPQIVPQQDKERLAALMTTLSDSTVQSAFGGSVYDTAKANILVWFQEPAKSEVQAIFSVFEENLWNQDTMKSELDQIINRAAQERDAGTIDEVDFNYIRNNLCDIILYYELSSKTCGWPETATTNDQQAQPDNQGTTSPQSSSTLKKVLKILLIIVVILAVIFGVLIAIFAIKAKKQQQQLSDNENWSEETSWEN